MHENQPVMLLRGMCICRLSPRRGLEKVLYSHCYKSRVSYHLVERVQCMKKLCSVTFSQYIHEPREAKALIVLVSFGSLLLDLVKNKTLCKRLLAGAIEMKPIYMFI